MAKLSSAQLGVAELSAAGRSAARPAVSWAWRAGFGNFARDEGIKKALL